MANLRNPGGLRLAALALGVFAALPAAAFAAVPVSPPVVEYRIEVSLDPEAKTLKGREQLTWRNPSSDTVSRAPLPHVPERLQEPALDVHAGVRRPVPQRQDGEQARGLGMDRRVLDPDAGGAELRPGARFIQPDANDPEDQTVLSVPLPSPVPPARRDHARDRLRRQASQDLRAHRIRARLLPRRPVVSEDRRLRAGGDARTQEPAAGTATRSTPNPSSTPTTGTST